MKNRTFLFDVWLLSLALATILPGSAVAQRPVFRKPPPAGVVELTGLGISSVVELKDGRLLSDRGSISTDGGRTWSKPGTMTMGGQGDDLALGARRR